MKLQKAVTVHLVHQLGRNTAQQEEGKEKGRGEGNKTDHGGVCGCRKL